jgi:HSP20 family protein
MNSCCKTTNGSCETVPQNQTESTRKVRPARTFAPIVDIVETADRYTLKADIPGADAHGVDVNFEDGVLSLRAAVSPRQSEGTRWLVREYGVGSWERTFRIGEGIDPSRIEAVCRDGVLTLTLPKVESARPRKIEVRSN